MATRRDFTAYEAAVVHALGGEPSTGVTKNRIVNDAVQHLCAIHAWKWRMAGPVALSFAASVSITGGTWTETTPARTLTKTNAFLNYTFRVGDVIDITGGTGASTGRYLIESRTSNDAIVLRNSIGSAADTQVDIAASLFSPRITLPADFGEDYTLTYPGSFTQQTTRTTLEVIERLRASPVQPVANVIYYCIHHGGTTLATSEETTLAEHSIEIYPMPSGALTNFLSVTYRRDIPTGATTTVPAIPPWLDYPLELLCRSFAMVVEDDNHDNPSQMAFDKMLPDLVRRDAGQQMRLGPMRGGLYPRDSGVSVFYPDHIGDPTSV